MWSSMFNLVRAWTLLEAGWDDEEEDEGVEDDGVAIELSNLLWVMLSL